MLAGVFPDGFKANGRERSDLSFFAYFKKVFSVFNPQQSIIGFGYDFVLISHFAHVYISHIFSLVRYCILPLLSFPHLLRPPRNLSAMKRKGGEGEWRMIKSLPSFHSSDGQSRSKARTANFGHYSPPKKKLCKRGPRLPPMRIGRKSTRKTEEKGFLSLIFFGNPVSLSVFGVRLVLVLFEQINFSLIKFPTFPPLPRNFNRAIFRQPKEKSPRN